MPFDLRLTTGTPAFSALAPAHRVVAAKPSERIDPFDIPISFFNLAVIRQGWVSCGHNKLMEGYIILVLLLIGAPIALGIWLIVRAVGARQSIDELRRRLGSLELEVSRLKEGTTRPASRTRLARNAGRRSAGRG